MGANGQEHSSGLPEYRAIDPLVHVGQVPLAYCVQVQESAAEHRSPVARLDSAWVALETSLAMTRELNPQTDEPFTRKELAAAKQDAQTGFRTILRDEELPLVTRVSAGVGLASVNMQHEMATRQPFRPGNMSFVHYLQGLQKASQLLLQKGEYTPEEDHTLRALTSIAIMTEYAEKMPGFCQPQPDKLGTLMRLIGNTRGWQDSPSSRKPMKFPHGWWQCRQVLLAINCGQMKAIHPSRTTR